MVYTLLALSLAAWFPAGQGVPATRPITVSAAVSLTEALTAVAEAYGRTGGHVRFNFAASAAPDSTAARAARALPIGTRRA